MAQIFSDEKEDSIIGLKYHLILGLNTYLWIPAFEFAVSRLPTEIRGWNVLEIGAGMGGLSLYFAMRGCNVICSDINSNYVSLAKKFHKLHEFSGQIKYETVDILNNNLKSESFDVVCFKSVLGAIPYDKQGHAISEIQRILKKGGLLIFCENLKGGYLSAFYRRLFVPWHKRWDYLTINQMYQYMSLFFECKINSFWFFAPFFARISQKLGRKGIALDLLLFMHLENEYRYIMGGYAIK